MDLLATIPQRTVIFDGATGTELMRRGLQPGECPEAWNVERPDDVAGIARDYFAAGSDMVATNSFGGTRLKLAAYGKADEAAALNLAAVRLAVAVRDLEFPGRLVAGDIGPSGKMLKPMGDGDPGEIRAAFAEQTEALVAGGADLLNLATMFDLTEARLATEAAVAASAGRPVLASLAFQTGPKGYRTMMGVSPAAAVATLREAGASLVGCNCELTAEEMTDLVPELAELNGGVTCAQPNAGQPHLVAGATVYEETAEHFAAVVAGFPLQGAGLVGGCCGSTPAFIAALVADARALAQRSRPRRLAPVFSAAARAA